MTSRLTFAAAVFAILGTATLTFATESPVVRSQAQRQVVQPAGEAMPVIVLPQVEVIGKRAR